MLRPEADSRFYRLLRRAVAHQQVIAGKSSRTVQSAHYRALLRWLCLRIEEQCADLQLLIAEQPASGQSVFQQWLRAGQFQLLLPDCALAGERELFLTDLALVLEVCYQ